MRRWAWVVPILALGCRGELFDYSLPGSGQPPTSFTPALAFRIGGPGSDLIAAMASDPAGGFFLAGTFSEAADLDPSTGVTALNSAGGADGFLARYSPTGQLLWARRFGGSRDETVTALARDPAGNLYIAGGFEGDAAFDPSATGLVLNSAGGADGFVAKFSSDGQPLWGSARSRLRRRERPRGEGGHGPHTPGVGRDGL